MKKEVKLKVLIVDNLAINLEVLIKVLITAGCQIDIVDNKKQAYNKITSKYYNIYFVNINLDGFNLISLIKNTNEKAKIVVQCGDISLEMEQKVRALGITYLLKYPFAENEIKELIDYAGY